LRWTSLGNSCWHTAYVQPHPSVSRADVERVVRRDFAPDEFEHVMTALDEYGTKDWQRERDRVQLAVLKLAAGTFDGLHRYINLAKLDYRDVLAPAEYPGYTKKMFRIDRLPAQERQRIIDADWKQYQDWFTR
jgi:hypothetical protein